MNLSWVNYVTAWCNNTLCRLQNNDEVGFVSDSIIVRLVM